MTFLLLVKASTKTKRVSTFHDNVVDIEGDIELFAQEGENDSDDDSDESLHDDDDVTDDLKNPKGVVYSKTPYTGHLQNRNIMRQIPRRVVSPSNPTESFSLFFTEEMLYHVLKCTNIKVKSMCRSPYPRNRGPFSIDELKACIAVLIRAGVDRDNFSALQDLWDVKDSRPFYRATISFQRFKFFLSVVRFDDVRTREQRKQNDVLAAFSELWELANAQFPKFFIPKEDLTVDEQLLGYRGNVPGRTYRRVFF